MHIEKHAKKTTELMMRLLREVQEIRITMEIKPENMSLTIAEDLTEAYEALSNHLFDVE